jgi:hypothetical protein
VPGIIVRQLTAADVAGVVTAVEAASAHGELSGLVSSEPYEDEGFVRALTRERWASAVRTSAGASR